MKVNRNALTKALQAMGFSVQFNDAEDAEEQGLSLTPLQTNDAEVSEIASFISALNEIGGIDGFKSALSSVQNTADSLKAIQEQLGGEEGLKSLLATVREANSLVAAHNAQVMTEKGELIKVLVANAIPFSQQELEAKPLDELKKLTAMLQPVSYGPMGGVVRNSEQNAGPLAPPAVFLAPVKTQ